MLPDKYRYIVVEGPIGAGKTSLARALSAHFQTRLLLEDAEENPFLPRFYRDMRRYALPTQLFFLFQRSQQLQELAQEDLFANKVTVSDFMLDKDPIFAKLTLTDDEYLLYQQIYRQLEPQVPQPDLLIYLQAAPEVLIERVKKRGLAFEKSISENYLSDLAQSYSRFFYNYTGAPLLIINSENLNFVDDRNDFELLLDRVKNMRGSREFFNRGE